MIRIAAGEKYLSEFSSSWNLVSNSRFNPKKNVILYVNRQGFFPDPVLNWYEKNQSIFGYYDSPLSLNRWSIQRNMAVPLRKCGNNAELKRTQNFKANHCGESYVGTSSHVYSPNTEFCYKTIVSKYRKAKLAEYSWEEKLINLGQ